MNVKQDFKLININMPNKLTTEEFIKHANEAHGNKYDYSNTIYVNSTTKVEIYCQNHNVVFWQLPNNHFKPTTGCRSCANEKVKQNSLKKYNVEHPAQSIKVKEKIRETNLKRYGVSSPFGATQFQEKSKQTMLERHGVEYAQQSEEILQKTKNTNLKNYGVENVFQSEKIVEKANQTNLEKYGNVDPGNLQYFRDKAIQTCKKRYGVDNHEQINIPKKSLALLNDIAWLTHQHHINEFTLTKIAEMLQVCDITIGRYFKKYNIEVKSFFRSNGEIDVATFIQSLGYTITCNTYFIIPPYELDIFIPELNIALEYNGLYWHQSRGINYHKNKTTLCQYQNITLIHIWEDQWQNNKEQTKEKIIKNLNNKPQVSLLEKIEIDLATDNPQIYKNLDYKTYSQSEPQLYSKNIWDCGKMILIKS